MLDLSFLNQLHPVTPPASPIDRMAKLISLQNAAIQGQDLQAQVQERQAAAVKSSQAEQKAARMAQILSTAKVDPGTGTPDPDSPEMQQLFREFPEVHAALSEHYAKVANDAATAANQRGDLTVRQGTLAEAVRKNAADEFQKKIDADRLANKPIEVSPNATVIPAGQALPYTAPPVPRVQVPGVDIPYSPEVAAQREKIAQASKAPVAPQVVYMDDPENPGHQIVATVDKSGGTAAPVTIGGRPAIRSTAQEQNRSVQADIVMNYADHILDLINKNPEAVGPILGRIARGETVIGNVSPEAKAIGTALGSFTALQPILHGYRGGSQTVDHFTSVLGDQKLNAAALRASIMEIKTLATQIKNGPTDTPRGVDLKSISTDDLLKMLTK